MYHVDIAVDLPVVRRDNRGTGRQQLVPNGVHIGISPSGMGLSSCWPGLKKVYIMRSAIRTLGVGALALLLAPLGIAQTQGSTTQDSSSSAQTSQTSPSSQSSQDSSN